MFVRVCVRMSSICAYIYISVCGCVRVCVYMCVYVSLQSAFFGKQRKCLSTFVVYTYEHMFRVASYFNVRPAEFEWCAHIAYLRVWLKIPLVRSNIYIYIYIFI